MHFYDGGRNLMEGANGVSVLLTSGDASTPEPRGVPAGSEEAHVQR